MRFAISRIVFLPAIVSVLLFEGCATITMAPDNPTPLKKLTFYSVDEFNADLLAYNRSKEKGDSLKARTDIRDRIVKRISGLIQENFNNFTQDSYLQQSWTNTALDVAVIGLGAAGPLTGGEALKNIFLAASGGITGSKAAFQKNFYADNTPKSIRLRSKALMTAQWEIIIAYLKADDDHYTLYDFIPNLTAYYNAGTVQAAFDDIDADTGAKQTTATNDLTQQQKDDAALKAAASYLGEEGSIPQTVKALEIDIDKRISAGGAAMLVKVLARLNVTPKDPNNPKPDLRLLMQKYESATTPTADQINGLTTLDAALKAEVQIP